jgi:hypothetical protein
MEIIVFEVLAFEGPSSADIDIWWPCQAMRMWRSREKNTILASSQQEINMLHP